MLLTITSYVAQEESRSISENVKWGQRKRMADGKFSMPYSKFLGYEKGEDGRMVVNEDQAKVVEQIYGLFIAGLSPVAIAKKLTDAGIPSPTGKEKWCEGTIRSILKNEKYKGCALLQKTFTPDFLTKIESVKDLPEPITEFDESLLCMAPSSHMWAGLVDCMTVHSKDRIVSRLTCWMEIEALTLA